MSHTCKKAVHVPGMCGNPERSNPGVQVNDPEKMRNFQRISGMYTNNLVGKCPRKICYAYANVLGMCGKPKIKQP